MKDQHASELTLQPAWDRNDKTKAKETYEGEFYIQPKARKEKRVVNKRSNLQSFTCK